MTRSLGTKHETSRSWSWPSTSWAVEAVPEKNTNAKSNEQWAVCRYSRSTSVGQTLFFLLCVKIEILRNCTESLEDVPAGVKGMSFLLWTTKETSSGKRTARNESFGTTVAHGVKVYLPYSFFPPTDCSKKTWAILCRKARKTIWHSTATARYKDLVVLNKCYSKLKANPQYTRKIFLIGNAPRDHRN